MLICFAERKTKKVMAPTKREMAWLLAKKEKKEQEIVIVAVNVVSMYQKGIKVDNKTFIPFWYILHITNGSQT